VAGYLPQLLPSLEVPEPQTRWMVIHALGCCAALDPATALEALPRAEAFAEGNSGACLWGATVVYLGYVGATSEANARAVYPILARVLHRHSRQAKNVLESFLRMLDRSDPGIRAAIAIHAETYVEHETPAVRRVARRIQRSLGQR